MPVDKEKLCEACGAEVREGADFCYNCGEAVSPEAIERSAAARLDTEKTNGAKGGVLIDEIRSKDSAPEPRGRLRSAADIKRSTKRFEKKPVEMVWVEPSRPSPLFVLSAIVLSVLAVILLVLALYLR